GHDDDGAGLTRALQVHQEIERPDLERLEVAHGRARRHGAGGEGAHHPELSQARSSGAPPSPEAHPAPSLPRVADQEAGSAPKPMTRESSCARSITSLPRRS